MRKNNLFLILLLFSIHLCAENNFDCISESRKIFTTNLLGKINYCCIDFIKQGESMHKILIVDISTHNDTVSIWIEADYDSYILLLKRPDGFIQYKDNLAFLFTRNYSLAKDTVWLDKLYSLSKKTTVVTTYSIVSWGKNIFRRNKYINENFNKKYNTSDPDSELYEPITYKYIFINDVFKVRKIDFEIIHPNLYIPKDIDKPWTW